MADETTPTPGEQPAAQPDAGAQPAAQPTQPYRAFATEADLTAFVQRSKNQAERSALRKLATDMGFEDADELKEALEPLRRGKGGTQTAQPGTPVAPAQQGPTGSPQGAERLKMALNVGKSKNLPIAIVELLQGDSEEAMTAHADQLMALFASGANRTPGIPGAPQQNQPVTFTRAQLQDAKFVREHANEIRAAAREGRIVNS